MDKLKIRLGVNNFMICLSMLVFLSGALIDFLVMGIVPPQVVLILTAIPNVTPSAPIFSMGEYFIIGMLVMLFGWLMGREFFYMKSDVLEEIAERDKLAGIDNYWKHQKQTSG